MTRQRFFCTLFAKNYLPRGLALYNSLKRHCKKFHLWILCIDQETHEILSRLNLTGVTLLRVDELENKKLSEIREKRTIGEYCWTCFPVLPHFLLSRNKNIDLITYLDADTFLYGSVEILYQKMGKNSVLIIPQNSSSDLKFLEKISGTYNTGVFIVKNDERGRKFLKWWASKCYKQCSSVFKKGEYGDQVHLDNVTAIFHGIYVLNHKGVNLGPWNISSYDVREVEGNTFIDKDPLIIYHFSGFSINRFRSGYFLEGNQKFFLQYIYEIKGVLKKLNSYKLNFYDKFFFEELLTIVKKNWENGKKTVKKTLKLIPLWHCWYSYLKKIRLGPVSNKKRQGLRQINIAIGENEETRKILLENKILMLNFVPKNVKSVIVENSTEEIGQKAFFEKEQAITCLNGSFILLQDNGVTRGEYLVDDCFNPLIHVKPRIWHLLHNFSHNCCFLIFSDRNDKEGDFVNDYELFLRYVRDN